MNCITSLFLTAVIAVTTCLPLQAYEYKDAPVSDDIAQLETHFFEHAYPNDSVAQRLSRLEKMVFGQVRSGSDQDRLTNLLTAVPAQNLDSGGDSQASLPDDQAQNDGPQTATSGDGVGSSNQGEDAYVPESSDYPHVTALETKLLGKTFTDEPVGRRLDQLEIKVFGHAASNQALADRVDRLEQYAESHLTMRPFGQNPDPSVYLSGADSGIQPAFDSAPVRQKSPPPELGAPPPYHGSLLQKVSWMEAQTYGHTFNGEHLLERLKRLDVALFPGEPPANAMKLMDQVDTLMAAVEHLHPDSNKGASDAPPEVASAGSDADMTPSRPPETGSGQSTAQSKHPYRRDLARILGAVGNIAIGSGSGIMGPGGYMGPGIWF